MKTVYKQISKLIMLIAVMVLLSFALNSDTEANAAVYDKMEVHFIDVGQGDCTLIKCGSHAMLIDAGDNDQGTKIQLYLNKHGVTKLDYFIITHPEADHLGGADVILYKFDCSTIIMPDCSNNTSTYRDVVDTMEYKRYKITYPVVGDTYTLGTATFTILGPSYITEDLNNDSVAIRLQNGNNSYLFLGDAGYEEEASILASGLNIKSDVMHIAHHGSCHSTSENFFEAVSPGACVISCGRDNEYGHPHSEVTELIKNSGSCLYRTDEQGNIISYSDGNTVTWNKASSTTWKSGEVRSAGTVDTYNIIPLIPLIPDSDAGNSITDRSLPSENGTDTVDYIANKNTGKFHYTWCKSVDDMKEKNKLYFTGTREEIVDLGYKPCKNCNP